MVILGIVESYVFFSDYRMARTQQSRGIVWPCLLMRGAKTIYEETLYFVMQ